MTRSRWSLGLGVAALLAVAALITIAVRSGPAEPGDDVPTTPVGEPAVFRLTGYEGAVTNPDARYVVVFKLNRDPVIEIDPDLEGPDEDRGSFGVAGYALGDYGQAESFGGRRHCFAGVVGTVADDDRGPQVRRLDRVPLGGRVAVALQPLTPDPASGKLVPGRNFVRHARLQSGGHRLSYGEVSARDERKLDEIGCG